MASLQLKQLLKDFGAVRVIHGVDLEVAHGEFTVFVISRSRTASSPSSSAPRAAARARCCA
jgi:ABC-type polar amino acid transport system ATPase subunit